MNSTVYKIDISLIALILANLAPLYGVLYGDWTIFQIFFLFWAETAVIGFYNVLKLIKVAGAASFFMVPFFIVHFGGFMLGHLIFISVMFGGILNGGTFSQAVSVITQNSIFLLIPILFFFISHGISYTTNFLEKAEFDIRNAGQQMMAPYSRVMLMHVTIIFGGWIVLALGAPVGALVLLVLGKIVFDISAHNRAHAKTSISSRVPTIQSQ